jgi:hypothetical protein
MNRWRKTNFGRKSVDSFRRMETVEISGVYTQYACTPTRALDKGEKRLKLFPALEVDPPCICSAPVFHTHIIFRLPGKTK